MTNLIIIGSEDYRYININSNKNNDMVLQTSKESGSGDRLFYGIKNNGRVLFQDENLKELSYLYFQINGEITSYQERYEGESSFIQLYDKYNPSNNGKEYYLSIAKAEQYAELFDFEEKSYTTRKSSLLYEKLIYSNRGTFIRLKNQNVDYDYFYLIVAVNEENDYIIVISKLFILILTFYQKLMINTVKELIVHKIK